MGKPAPIGFCTLHLFGGDVHIDLCDLMLVDPYNHKWTVIKKGNTKYAVTKILRDGKIKNIYMHRLILNEPNGVVDHIDRNGLNNRRANFRVVNSHENWVNSGPRERGKSRFKGVSPYGSNGKWRATIQVHRKWKHIGVFDTKEAAAKAYDHAALLLFGPTAYLNKAN
ncbi:MAG: endonuclease [Patescibacteria group bacterium]|nr:endonuclease [Patescibacteria group bacterium]